MAKAAIDFDQAETILDAFWPARVAASWRSSNRAASRNLQTRHLQPTPRSRCPCPPAPPHPISPCDRRRRSVTLSKLKGQTVILYFYPKDDTTGLHCRGLRLPRRNA